MSVLCRYILIDWVVEVTLFVCVVYVYSNRLGGRSRSDSVCLCCAGIF